VTSAEESLSGSEVTVGDRRRPVGPVSAPPPAASSRQNSLDIHGGSGREGLWCTAVGRL